MRRTTAVFVVALAVAAGSAGCGGDPASAPGPTSAGGTTVTPEQSRSLVVDALAGTWREVGSAGVTAAATGGYKQCADQGGAVQYVADVRVDPGNGDEGDGDFGDQLGDGLARAGWVLDPDASETPAGVRSRRGLRADLTVRLTSYRDQPFALIQVLGPCVPAGDEEGYAGRADERLPLP